MNDLSRRERERERERGENKWWISFINLQMNRENCIIICHYCTLQQRDTEHVWVNALMWREINELRRTEKARSPQKKENKITSNIASTYYWFKCWQTRKLLIDRCCLLRDKSHHHFHLYYNNTALSTRSGSWVRWEVAKHVRRSGERKGKKKKRNDERQTEGRLKRSTQRVRGQIQEESSFIPPLTTPLRQIEAGEWDGSDHLAST